METNKHSCQKISIMQFVICVKYCLFILENKEKELRVNTETPRLQSPGGTPVSQYNFFSYDRIT